MRRIRNMLAALLLAAFLCAQASCGNPASRAPAPFTPAMASVQPSSDASASPVAAGTQAIPTTAPDTTTSASGPATAEETGGFKLYVFRPRFFQEQHDEIVRIQTALNEKGWRVSFVLESYGEETETSQEQAVIHNLIAKHAASGDTLADGWIVPAGMTKPLVDEGIAQDMGDTLRQAAPLLITRFQGLFEKSAAGVPVYMRCRPAGGALALALKEEYAARVSDPLNGIDGLLTLAGSLGNDKLYLGESSLYDMWAYRQGYYPLSPYGIQGMLFAAYDDVTCTPVPLESIAGFSEFLGKCYRLYKTAAFSGDIDQARTDIAGYITNMDAAPTVFFPATQRYVTLPLGYTPLTLPDDAPRVSEEVAVSARSSRAADIARCAEWLFTSQENYDAVSYGKQGEDYRITAGNRLELLNHGNPLGNDSALDIDMLYHRHMPFFFFDSMKRATVYAPVNYEEALASCKHRPEPFRNLIAQGGYDEEAIQMELSSITVFTDTRYEALAGIFSNAFLMIKPEMEFVSTVCSKLEAASGDTEALVYKYSEFISEMQQTKGE